MELILLYKVHIDLKALYTSVRERERERDLKMNFDNHTTKF